MAHQDTHTHTHTRSWGVRHLGQLAEPPQGEKTSSAWLLVFPAKEQKILWNISSWSIGKPLGPVGVGVNSARYSAVGLGLTVRVTVRWVAYSGLELYQPGKSPLPTIHILALQQDAAGV